MECRSEIAASVWKIRVAVGDEVAADQELMVLESMKMEIPVVTTAAGTVAALHVNEGDQVVADQVLAIVEERS